jgi:peptidoglycan/xylan/chitin deacetylase (PgdA/CDA1 family)
MSRFFDRRAFWSRISQAKMMLALSVAATMWPCGLMAETAAESPAATPSNKADVILVFRYDDYSGKTDLEAFETNMLAIFEKHGVALTIGVIPEVCSGDVHDPSPQSSVSIGPDRVAPISRELPSKLLEVAQHGLTHKTVREGPLSEYVGVPYEEQLVSLRRGKMVLEALFHTPVVTFIPPWNSYDENTAKALDVLGVKVLSAELKTEVSSPHSFRKLPATCGLDEVDRAIGQARELKGESVVVVLFHGYDFDEVRPGRGMFSLRKLDSLINRLLENSACRFETISEAAKTRSYLESTYVESLKRAPFVSSQLLLPRSRRERILVLPSLDQVSSLRNNVAFHALRALLAWYCGALAAGLVFAWLTHVLGRRWPWARIGVAWCGTFGLVACLAFVAVHGADRLYCFTLPLAFVLPIIWIGFRGKGSASARR